MFQLQTSAVNHKSLVLVVVTSQDGGITEQPMTARFLYMAVAKATRTTLKRDKPVCGDAVERNVSFFTLNINVLNLVKINLLQLASDKVPSNYQYFLGFIVEFIYLFTFMN